jgi:hypothetical protein
VKPFSCFILHRTGRLEQLDLFLKKNNQRKKKEKDEGFSQLFFFTKLTIQS